MTFMIFLLKVYLKKTKIMFNLTKTQTQSLAIFMFLNDNYTGIRQRNFSSW